MGHHKSFLSSLPSFVPSLVLPSLSLTSLTGVLDYSSIGCFLVCKGHLLVSQMSQANPARHLHPCHVEHHVPQHLPCTVTAPGQAEERMVEKSCQVGHGCPGGHQGPGAITKPGSLPSLSVGSKPADSPHRAIAAAGEREQVGDAITMWDGGSHPGSNKCHWCKPRVIAPLLASSSSLRLLCNS